MNSIKEVVWTKTKQRDYTIFFESLYIIGLQKKYFELMGVFGLGDVSNIALGDGRLFYDTEQMEKARNILRAKRDQLPVFVKEMTDKFMAICAQYESFLAKHRLTNFSTLPREKIARVYKEFNQYNYALVPYSYIISMILEDVAREKILPALESTGDAVGAYTLLTIPAKKNRTTEEYAGKLRIAALFKEGKDAGAKIKEHLAQYAWVNLYKPTDPLLTAEKLRKDIEELAEGNPSDEIQQIENERQHAFAEAEKIRTTIQIPTGILTLLNLMRENAWVRTYRRELMGMGYHTMRPLFTRIVNELGISFTEIQYLTSEDVEAFLKNNTRVPEEELAQRRQNFACVKIGTDRKLLVGDAANIEPVDAVEKSNGIFKGKTIYQGTISGPVRVLTKKEDIETFKQGDVLVASTVTTWMNPVVEKCSAILTEEGGVLSHTAIVAREFRKPCISGIPHVTELLKTGMHVDVNATEGIATLQKEKEKFDDIKNYVWLQRWAQPCTFISCTYWGPQYFFTLQRFYGKTLATTVGIHKKGYVSCHMNKDQLDEFGTFLAKKTEENPKWALHLLDVAKLNYDKFRKIMENHYGKLITQKEYAEFYSFFDNFTAYQVLMKKPVDYLSPDAFTELFPKFQETRVYCEDVYKRTEAFFPSVMKAIGEKENYDSELLTCMTQEEFENYLATTALPDKETLKQRWECSAVITRHGKTEIITGQQVAELEKALAHQTMQSGIVKGNTAHPGKVIGVCRLIQDPSPDRVFNDGEIIVTAMTDPRFLPLMARAGAFVTDAGGMLCHAAITAREMKKPCVIGTQVATKIFKEGDLLKVDATMGTVKKI